MTQHYTNADVRVALAAFQAACATSPTVHVDSQRALKHTLDAIAPAIAARALRDGQRHHEAISEVADNVTSRHVHLVIAGAFQTRADEIERGA